MLEFPIPISFPNASTAPEDGTLLAADIGATKTNLALFHIENGEFVSQRELTLQSRQWNSLTEMLYRSTLLSSLPDKLAIAFAGPLQGEKAHSTNLGWTIDMAELRQTLRIPKSFLINDLEANAYGLASLHYGDLEAIYEGPRNTKGNGAVIAPGTGLGEAGLYWDGRYYHPFSSEGGHTDFGPRNDLDISLLKYIQNDYDHVSWERVLSGPGIEVIYHFLVEYRNLTSPLDLELVPPNVDLAATIAQAANEGCALCKEVLEIFIRYLSEECANLAMAMKAHGGVFIGGGILPKIWNEKLKEVFLDNYFQVGRLRPLMLEMPVFLILNPKTSLQGAAYYGAFSAN